MSAWQAIIFDLDDTLYPERDFVLSGFRAVARWAEDRFGIPEAQGFGELHALFEAGVRGDTFNRWLIMHDIEPGGYVPELLRVYRDHPPALVPYAGVPELLAGLARQYRLGLVSDGYLAVQRRKLEALKLSHYFHAIVFSDEWGREAWKPNPQPFWAVLERLEAEPSRAVYIADNPLKDFFGARSIGIKTIWFRQAEGEYARREPPSELYAADLIIETLSAMEQALLML